MNIDDYKKQAHKKYMEEEFKDKVLEFINKDIEILQERKKYNDKIKKCKEEKQKLEEYIVKVLDNQNENIIKYDGGKLIKETKKNVKNLSTKDTLNMIFDKLNTVILEKQKRDTFIDDITNAIEKRKVVTTKTVLVRKKDKD